jgi:hypothetical protein
MQRTASARITRLWPRVRTDAHLQVHHPEIRMDIRGRGVGRNFEEMAYSACETSTTRTQANPIDRDRTSKVRLQIVLDSVRSRPCVAGYTASVTGASDPTRTGPLSQKPSTTCLDHDLTDLLAGRGVTLNIRMKDRAGSASPNLSCIRHSVTMRPSIAGRPADNASVPTLYKQGVGKSTEILRDRVVWDTFHRRHCASSCAVQDSCGVLQPERPMARHHELDSGPVAPCTRAKVGRGFHMLSRVLSFGWCGFGRSGGTASVPLVDQARTWWLSGTVIVPVALVAPQNC